MARRQGARGHALLSAGLKIARGFALPLDVVTEALGIVATRGAGKSYTSAVLLEEAHAAGVPFVVLDPAGVYHGLRSNAAGDGPGLSVYVLGGQHGDLPLEQGTGAFLADLVVDSGHSFVLDLSDLTKARSRAFVADFLERLYERKARHKTNLLLVIDEADEFAPQLLRGLKGDGPRCLGAVETVTKRGRSRGVGVVLITQRTQALNKDVLDLIETLIAMRQLAERSRDAVQGWIADKDLRDEAGVIESLQSLPTGTAWVWSPLRAVLEKVRVRQIRTFDSYRTPKPGEVPPEPDARAELDLEALGEQMQATVERAKANDPATLRARVRELERELAERPSETTVETVVETVEVEVPVVPDGAADDLRAAIARGEGLTSELAVIAGVISGAGADVAAALAKASEPRPAVPPRHSEPSRRQPERPATAPIAPPSAPRPAPGAAAESGASGGASTNGELNAGARNLLETLARHHPLRVSPGQLGVLARRKPRGGSWTASMKQLRDGGYVRDEGGELCLTEDGLAAAGVEVGAAPTPQETIARWREALPTSARALFEELVRHYPAYLTADELAAYVGRQPRGGSWTSAVSTLVKNGLAERSSDGRLRAGESLFLAAA